VRAAGRALDAETAAAKKQLHALQQV